jgi:GDP-D-mannose dehydratase
MSNRKKALITGITGQDGSYLAEFLRADSSKAKRELGWAPKAGKSSAIKD